MGDGIDDDDGAPSAAKVEIHGEPSGPEGKHARETWAYSFEEARAVLVSGAREPMKTHPKAKPTSKPTCRPGSLPAARAPIGARGVPSAPPPKPAGRPNTYRFGQRCDRGGGIPNDGTNVIFVGRLAKHHPKTSDDDLFAYFSQFGPLLSAR